MNQLTPQRTAFLDRDGVLVEDIDWLSHPDQIRIFPGVPEALVRLVQAGFQLIVVTNQPIVARGLITEEQLQTIHLALAEKLAAAGAPLLTHIYYCPHHPKATLPAYRLDCLCRKPKPGLLLRAATDLGLDPAAGFMVGDRMSDIAAGAAAGCRTILVQTGKHLEAPIQTSTPVDPLLKPDWTCADLPAAVQWIIDYK